MARSSPSAPRTVFHVVFQDGWRIKEENKEPLPKSYQTKDEAIQEARRIAKAAPLGQVIIHKQDHTIENEYTYGDDPRDYPG